MDQQSELNANFIESFKIETLVIKSFQLTQAMEK